jgi:predicted GNAT family acetyltransferase
MPWELTDDPERYAAHVWDLLAAEPARHTVALTVLESVRAGRRWSDDPMLFGWHGEAPAVGAVSMTPPFTLHLARVPAELVAQLVSALRSVGASVPGVNGEVATVDRFVAAWTAAGPVHATTTMRQRLYALQALAPPVPPPAGRARRASAAEVERVAGFVTAFLDEVGLTEVDPATIVRDQISDRLVWLWEDAGGEVVSMASRHRTAAGVARVGPVFTPTEHRRHGYGAAVTAACTRDALERDADDVVLFTDLDNPTSNAIYQRLGYLPVSDHAVVRFRE